MSQEKCFCQICTSFNDSWHGEVSGLSLLEVDKLENCKKIYILQFNQYSEHNYEVTLNRRLVENLRKWRWMVEELSGRPKTKLSSFYSIFRFLP